MTYFPGRVKHFSYASLSEYTYLDLRVSFLYSSDLAIVRHNLLSQDTLQFRMPHCTR